MAMEAGEPKSWRPSGRERAAVGLGVLALGLLGWWAWGNWNEPDYLGATEPATLTWSCSNGVFWKGHDHVWWYGPDDTLSGTGAFATHDESASTYTPTWTATGTMHFNSASKATFTSDLGMSITMTKQREGVFYPAGCAITTSRFGL